MRNVSILLSILLTFLFYGCQDDAREELQDMTASDATDMTRAGGSNADWDWTKAESFDYAYITGMGKVKISSPFTNSSSTDVMITNIIRAKDYLPIQGWTLLVKNFGTPSDYVQTQYPYFMLYNKYTGIMRLFILNQNSNNYDRAAATLSWDNDTGKNAFFSQSEVYQSANGEYHNGNKKSGTIVNYVTNYYSHAWFVTDFPVNFDPQINYSDNFVLRFKLLSKVSSTVHLESEFEFKTMTANSNSSSSSSSSRYKFLEKGQKYLSVIPTTDEIEKSFKDIEKGLDPAKYEGHKKLQNTVTKMRDDFNNGSFKKALSTIGGVGSFLNGTVGAGIGLLSKFFGKSNSKTIPVVQIMPTVSSGSEEITGEITTITNATAFPLQLPGCNHHYSRSVNIDGLPMYDYPLGVISLENTPKLASKEAIWASTNSDSYFDRGNDSFFSQSHIYTNYQMADNVNLALNAHSGTEVIGIKARLLCKHQLPYSTEKAEYRTYEITKRIERGEYELIENNDKSFTYGTSLVDISKFKNTSLLVSDLTHTDLGGITYNNELKNPIYMQLLIVLKPTDSSADQTPIVFNTTYILNKSNYTGWSNSGVGNALVLRKYTYQNGSYKPTISGPIKVPVIPEPVRTSDVHYTLTPVYLPPVNRPIWR